MAFIRTVSEGVQDLFEIPVEGGSERQLTRAARSLSGLAWVAPEQLLFASAQGGRSQLWLLDTRTRISQRLSIPAVPVNPDWRQGKLVFEEWQSETNLWRLDLARSDSAPTEIIHSTRWDLHPRISPDQSSIAFTSNRSGTYNIWIADSRGREPRQLSRFSEGFAGTPRWSPDSRSLVFDARPEGQADLFVVSLGEGATPQPLVTHPAEDLAPY